MSTVADGLAATFPSSQVSWRVGSTNADKSRGMALAYIDARDVMNRLDTVCGPFGWQSRHEVSADGKKVTCHIGVRAEDGTWVWKSDGAGETDYEGEKGSYSDSLKRAAVSWGIGRYLYDLPTPWIAIEAKGKSYVIPPSELGRLAKLLDGVAMPAEREPARTTAKEPAPAAPPTGNIGSASMRARLLAAMNKEPTRPDLRKWADKEQVQGAIEALNEKDRSLFNVAFAARWKELPESLAMAG